MNQEELENRIEYELKELQGQTARQIALAIGVDKRAVNSLLYSSPKFVRDESLRPCWFLTDSAQEGSKSANLNSRREPLEEFEISGLRQWQKAALETWQANGSKGIVQAVTGAGKTLLGIAAIAQELNCGGKAAVIVPSIELQKQWFGQLSRYFPTAAIGCLGGGYHDFLTNHDILIAIVNSASMFQLGLLDSENGLLVADECHHLAAETFKRALEPIFENRLGITATIERADGGHVGLEEYFGSVVYTIGYREAIENKYISGVKVAQIAVNFSSQEQTEYDELSENINSTQHVLSMRFNLSIEPFSKFMDEIIRIAAIGDIRDKIVAKTYLSSINKRKTLLAETSQKLEIVKNLVPAINSANGTIFFTETIQGAESIALGLNQSGVAATTIHSKLSRGVRSQALLDFESGKIQAITAARVIDEGVDVPEADLAVIIAASKTKRQMIQRMGRVLRPKSDGRLARFVLVFVAGTTEDPRLGAHDAFWSEVLDIAAETYLFESPIKRKNLTNFLDPSD